MVQKYLSVFVILWVFFEGYVADNAPEVDTRLGRVRGSYKESYEGYKFSAFEGVPYAKPPVDELRFEEPVPIEPWKETIDATKATACPQRDIRGLGPVAGAEDCLYLNIYVPGTVDPKKKYDVQFFIHGGALMLGFGQIASAIHIMDQQNVIFVSINYRLGPLGFLSTEDKEIPGNNGMKDQVMALKWVRDNIQSFGGNPQSVTITGFSAGGASVHLHYLSPWSKNLFIRGISNSGSAISPWFLKEQPLVFAQKLAEYVGCPSSSTSALKSCLKTKPVNILMEPIGNLMEYSYLPMSPFGVVVDTWAENPFVPEHPYTMLVNGKILDLPWIASLNRDEGIYPAGFFCTNKKEINKDFIDKAHLLLDYNYTLPEEDRKKFATKIRDYYFGTGNDMTEDNYNNMIQMFGDRLFISGVQMAAKLQSQCNTAPVYSYVFNYDKSVNKVAALYCPEKQLSGVAHCDDTVFAYGFFTFQELSESDKNMKKTFQKFMNSFITEGKPILDNVNWIPSKGHDLTYLSINNYDDLKMNTVSSLYPKDVWSELIKSEFNFESKKSILQDQERR